MNTNLREFEKDPSIAVGQELSELLNSCPICEFGLAGHQHALLATAVVPRETDEVFSGFFEAIKAHNWDRLHEYQTWLGKADDVEAYAIRCSERVSIVITKTHFELFQHTRLIYCEALSVEETRNFQKTFVSLKWHEI